MRNLNTISWPIYFAWIAGVVLAVLGIIGLVQLDGKAFTDVMGLALSNDHSIVLLITGILGVLAALIGLGASRVYALVVGILALIFAIGGFADAGFVTDMLGYVNNADSILHLVVGILGVGAWGLSHSEDRNIINR